MSTAIRVVGVGLVCVLLAVVGLAGERGRSGAAQGSDSEGEALDGRLGGTRASFEAKYGAPVVENTVNGSRYVVEGFGLVLVSYRQLAQTVGPEDVAAVVVLRAPRAETVPATTTDEADWTMAEARAIAMTFLPADAELGESVATPTVGTDARTGIGGRGEMSCRSDALAESSPKTLTTTPDACTVTLLMPTEATVSFVTLALGDTASLDADPCVGMEGWGTAVGERLERANAALAEIGTVTEDDPSAGETLSGIALGFTELAEEAAEADVPEAAVAANAALVAAFDGYAGAIGLAAEGVTAKDAGTLEEASVAVEEAGRLYREADGLVVAAVQGCGLGET